MTEELKLPDEREAFYAFANSIGLTLKQAEQMRAAILAERLIIDLLVAAGHVSAEKVDEARAIAANIGSGQ